MEKSIQFIDAHHHLWIPETKSPDLGYGWLRDIGATKPFGDPTPIQRNYEWAEYHQESTKHALMGSVYVQVDGAIADPVAETAWVQSVFNQTALQHGIVGLVDLSSEAAPHVIEKQSVYSSFKGVRQIISRLDHQPNLSFAPTHYLRHSIWREHFALLEQYQLSFDLQLYPEQMLEAAEFISQYPGVPVIIDHAGSPYDASSSGFIAWQEGLKALASLEHVAIKLSGFGMFDNQRTAESIKPWVQTILELFGSERVLYGSNFPVDKLMGTFNETLLMIDHCLQNCSSFEKDRIWFANAQRLYRLNE